MDQIGTGKFIANCRKEKGLTQAQLAERLGISDRAVSKWETGRNMPDIAIMEELCGILGITPNELLKGERETVCIVPAIERTDAAPSKAEEDISPVTAIAVREEGRGFLKMLLSGEQTFPAILTAARSRKRAGRGRSPVIDMELSPEEAQEILSGQPEAWEDCHTSYRQYGGESSGETSGRKYNKLFGTIFTWVMYLAAVICLIVDLAVSGNMGWSLIPMVSIVFSWLTFIPTVTKGRGGISDTLVLLSVLIFPYLWSMGYILQNDDVFRVGASAAVPSLLLLWVFYGTFKGSRSLFRSLGICCLSAVPFLIIINFIMSRLIPQPIFDGWDMLTVLILVTAAYVLFSVPPKKADN